MRTNDQVLLDVSAASLIKDLRRVCPSIPETDRAWVAPSVRVDLSADGLTRVHLELMLDHIAVDDVRVLSVTLESLK